MHMCDKSSGNKSTASSNNLKSGITCNTCGGIGHYARFCPSKPKAGSGAAPVKVNLAVAKISTKEEYTKYLPKTKKEVGKCPCCNLEPHNYSRNFPFGKAEWPSNRLDSCPQFMSKSSKERGELIEKIKGCYKCTSFKHQGNACYIRKTSNCIVNTGGAMALTISCFMDRALHSVTRCM